MRAGGSLISDWEVADAYYTTMVNRIKANIQALTVLGKTVRLVIWYSLGINDMIASTDEATWKAAVIAFFVNFRSAINKNAFIVMTEFMAGNTGYNDSIQDIAANDSKTISIDFSNTTTYPLRDANHWNSVAMKKMAEQMVLGTLNYSEITD